MKNYSKYLCIFGGGAVRGYAYLGVVRAFEELGFCPKQLAGSSVGAIFATFCALGMNAEEIENTVLDINFELFRDINLKFSAAFSISKGEVFLNWLREIIEKHYYGCEYKKGKNKPVCFKDLKRDLILIATDLTNCVPFIFSKENTPDYEIAKAIRASASMPGLLSPVEYEDKLLTDGDLMKSNPIWKLDVLLCPEDLRILELRLEGISKDNKIKNLMDYFNKIYSCVTNYSTDFIIDVYAQRDKFDYIKIDTKDLLLVNFNINHATKNKLINIGYDTTMQYFKEKLPKKREKILANYSLIAEKINEFETYIEINNIKKAKRSLGDIFEHLADIKKIIDYTTHKKLKLLRNSFYNNITCTLFGKERLKDRRIFLEELKSIKNILAEKCNELSK